jgi:hypothetical protein
MYLYFSAFFGFLTMRHVSDWMTMSKKKAYLSNDSEVGAGP